MVLYESTWRWDAYLPEDHGSLAECVEGVVDDDDISSEGINRLFSDGGDVAVSELEPGDATTDGSLGETRQVAAVEDQPLH